MNFESVPCPHRIVDDMGSAFAMGCIGGSVWHFGKGYRNTPRGERLYGGYQNMALRAPTLGGNFAVWGGLFSFYDCLFAHTRKREDPWNAIGAGAATGGTLALRAGPKAVGTNAVIGGVLLALIEGLGVLVGKMSGTAAQQQQAQQQLMPPPPFVKKDGSLAQAGSSSSQQYDVGAELNDSFNTEDFSFNNDNMLDDELL